jgi:translocation and assembly module TamB
LKVPSEASRLTGELNFGRIDRATSLPIFHFKLRGTNVPLARQPEFIIRSDIALNISNEKGGEPFVSGELNLRDSYFLSDLKRLIPGKVAKPKQRPPYFSIETEPFANWRLNVAVKGTNFLKVRSPLFRGEISADLKIDGTLKEPIALGETKVDSGVVQFPFANLRVDQGFVALTSENPYRPQISLGASARTFGYEVKMELSGPVDQPNVVFSSNPGLRSEQILLMITAGELPRDEMTFSTEQKAQRLAFFFGKNLFSKFGSGGTEDRLEIRSGEDVSEQGRQTYYLEYKLSDDWSIIGEYDRFGAVNAGIKWKFFEK